LIQPFPLAVPHAAPLILTHGWHFAAWEAPDLFVAEVRKAFALMR